MSVLVLDAGSNVIKAKLVLLLADMSMAVGLDTIEQIQVLGAGSVQELDDVMTTSPEGTVVIEEDESVLAWYPLTLW